MPGSPSGTTPGLPLNPAAGATPATLAIRVEETAIVASLTRDVTSGLTPNLRELEVPLPATPAYASLESG